LKGAPAAQSEETQLIVALSIAHEQLNEKQENNSITQEEEKGYKKETIRCCKFVRWAV
jgi:hypothetical protein